MPTRPCTVGPLSISASTPLTIIAGPCVLESKELGLLIGRTIRDLCRDLNLSYIFKASYDKANRSSIRSPRGPGLEKGLQWIGEIGRELNVPTTTDIHTPEEAAPAAKAVDLLQIPAFLCRQTDLLSAAGEAAARHNRAINIKKGQFLSPTEMAGPLRKLAEAGCHNSMLTERGTTFGYGRLVNDFLGLGDMMDLENFSSPTVGPGSPPVCFDCTHSTQLPGAWTANGGEQTGGRPDRAPLLARAAAAAGVHALFIECHPEPRKGLSDSATMLPLDTMAGLLKSVAKIHQAIR